MNSIIYMSNNIYILIICYLPEIATYKDMNSLGYEILSSFKISANKNNKKINVIDIISCACTTKCLDSLKKMAKYLNEPANSGIVYYYDHRDDEKRTTTDISNVELSHIFDMIDRMSVLYMFNDSYYSDLMIDKKINDRNWITIGSARNRPDDHTPIDGGVFTIWGIFPALEALYNPTPIELHTFINSNILSHTTIEHGNSMMLNKKMFR